MDFGANDRDKEKKMVFKNSHLTAVTTKQLTLGGWEAEVSLRNSVPERGLPVTGKDLSRA